MSVNTFIEAKTRILRFIKRPETDAAWLTYAGEAVNDALLSLQQEIPNFKALGTVLPGVTYTANSDTISLPSVVSTDLEDINKIISIHLTSTLEAWTGNPLLIYDYNSFNQTILNYEQNRVPEMNESTSSSTSFSRYITNNYGYVAYLLGTDIGLYPRPTEDKILSVHYTKTLPNLVDDADTNVLLRFCWQYVFYFSLRQLNVLLSESNRIEVSNAILREALNQARGWNSSLEFSNPIEL